MIITLNLHVENNSNKYCVADFIFCIGHYYCITIASDSPYKRFTFSKQEFCFDELLEKLRIFIIYKQRFKIEKHEKSDSTLFAF
jgi:hypothetical protein